MTSFYSLKRFGEKLRGSNHTHLALEDLRSMLMQSLNVHGSKTLTHYMKVLEEWGYLKRVTVDGCPRFAIQRIQDGKYVIDPNSVVDKVMKK